MSKRYKNAQEAFEDIYKSLHKEGERQGNTLSLRNVGFYIDKPMQNAINTPYRKWNPKYAEREWQWYLSGNRNATEIAKKAPIWYNMMDEDGDVNSNYGWQWSRGNQLNYVIKELRDNPSSRRASISIYDAKDRHNFDRDTPCTYAVNFHIKKGTLNMAVMMRSNDIWFGFCNDQYCFTRLQELIADKLGILVGDYYHFTNNMHVYDDKMNLQKTSQMSLDI
jgi:thymidylate synthase